MLKLRKTKIIKLEISKLKLTRINKIYSAVVFCDDELCSVYDFPSLVLFKFLQAVLHSSNDHHKFPDVCFGQFLKLPKFF